MCREGEAGRLGGGTGDKTQSEQLLDYRVINNKGKGICVVWNSLVGTVADTFMLNTLISPFSF